MTDYSELKRLAEEVDLPGWYETEGGAVVVLNYKAACFVEAASPFAVLALIAENEALRKDAERYRSLRKVTPYRFKKMQDAAITDGGDVMYFHADRFDIAIDAAMSKEG